MKRIANSNIGVLLIGIIPAFPTYIAIWKGIFNNINIDMNQHTPFLAALSVFAVTVSFLYLRKWVIHRFDKASADIEQRIIASIKPLFIPNIRILDAKYGDTKTTDVTDRIKELVKEGIYEVKATIPFLKCDDPEYGIKKTLTIRYILGKNEITVNIKEGESLSLF